jgi:putative flippase GtrA
MKLFDTQQFRFAVAGGAATLGGYLLYLLLNLFFNYLAAYAISYLVGVVASYLVNSLYVFRSRLSWGGLLAYPSVYIMQFALGGTCVWLFVDRLGFPEWLAPLTAIALTLPITFLATRYLLTGRASESRRH